MEGLPEFWRRLLILLRRNRFDRDLQEEMQAHLKMQAEENRAAGMEAEEARYAARRQFGNMTLLQELSRDTWGWGSLERLGQDLKYVLRVLTKNPGFTTVTLLTLALGIGANTAIFSVLHAVLLAPLPYPEPDRLAVLFGASRFGNRIMMSAPDASDLRAQTTVFEDIAVAGYSVSDLAGPGEPERIAGSRITPNLFPVLGVQPIAGRGLQSADDQPAAPPVVVLSHALWQRRFGGDPSAIGKAITLGKQSRTIVGVMPPSFYFPSEKTEYWFPLGSDPLRTMRDARMFHVLGRLKAGATFEEARAEVQTIAARLESAYPNSNKGWRVEVVPLVESIVGDVRPALLIMFGAVGLVLLVACANVANLMLVRGVQRQREIAVRAALGAGRRRIMRLLLAESLVLALLGGAFGVVFAGWGLDALLPLYPPGLPRAAEIRVNTPVLAFTLLLSLGTGLLFGLMPAVRASRTDLRSALKSGVQSGFRTGRSGGLLVVVQAALAMVLLTCAGLLVKSFLLRTRVSGFDPSNLLVVDAPELPPAALNALLERLRSLPGVIAAGAGTSFPHAPVMSTEIRIENRPKSTEPAEALFDIVTPGYFRTLRVPLHKGRVTDERDTGASPAVVVINEAMARRYFPGEDPLGKRVHKGKSAEPWRTIVGVVGDVPPYGVDRESRPAMYLPFHQDETRPSKLAVRTAVPTQEMAAAVRSVIRALEPNAPVIGMATMEEDLSTRIASPRFYTVLLGLFAAVALGLASLGVYGVVSFAVSRRTHEIGVRMALGASSADVLKTVMGEGAALTSVGAAIGTLASLGAARLLTGLLFRVQPADPATFACVPVALLASTLAACWVPARRATRIDPMAALRYE